MSYIVLALFGLIGLVLQSTIFNELIIAGVKPDLILIIVILFSLFNGPRQGAFMGLVLGLLEDIFLAKYLGLNAASKFIVGLIIGFLEKSMFKDNLSVPVLTLFFGSLFYSTVYYVFTNIVGYSVSFDQLVRIAIPFAIYNTCFAPFVYGRFYKASTKGILKRNQNA